MTDTKDVLAQRAEEKRQEEIRLAEAKREQVLEANKADDEKLSVALRAEKRLSVYDVYSARLGLRGPPYRLYTEGHDYRPLNSCDRGADEVYPGALVRYRPLGTTKWRGPALVTREGQCRREWYLMTSKGTHLHGYFREWQLRLEPEVQESRLANRGFTHYGKVIVSVPEFDPVSAAVISVLGNFAAIEGPITGCRSFQIISIVPLKYVTKA